MKNEDKKTRFDFSIVEPRAAFVPKPVEKKNSSTAKYVSYGEDNLYPDYLLSCYEDCAVLQSVINGLSDYVAGSGFATGNEKLVVNEKGMTLVELVKKITVDYIIFGAFSIGVRRDKDGIIRYLDYHDPRKIRLGEDENKAYYCKDWERSTKKVMCIDTYQKNPGADRTEYYVKTPISRGVYGRPVWAGAIKDVQTSIEISTFHLSAILNNFAPSAIVNFNNGQPEEEQQKKIEKKLNEKFSGTKNAARLLVCFNETKEHATDIQRLSEDNFDQRYGALAKSVKENIFISFRAQPQLFGADPERTGFNSIEYEQSFSLYKETVVKPIQQQIEDAFAKISDEFRFTLNEFNVNFAGDKSTKNEEKVGGG